MSPVKNKLSILLISLCCGFIFNACSFQAVVYLMNQSGSDVTVTITPINMTDKWVKDIVSFNECMAEAVKINEEKLQYTVKNGKAFLLGFYFNAPQNTEFRFKKFEIQTSKGVILVADKDQFLSQCKKKRARQSFFCKDLKGYQLGSKANGMAYIIK